MHPRYLEQKIPEGETPTIRLLRDVRGDLAFSTVARAGVHKAYLNRLGAVSVIAENGQILGIKPDEFEWISGKPSRWGHGTRRTFYEITPYDGDWTMEAASEAAQRLLIDKFRKERKAV